MKPDFALTLSFKGIGLLCREASGWRHLGDVDVAADDLSDQLAQLRQIGDTLEADFRCKIVLPNEQVRYLKIDTGRSRESVRRAKAIDALKGATPYSTDELSFDIVTEGRTTFVAAVARETLAEAESFATENGFNPVGFVAIPTEDDFPREPNFGTTSAASDRGDDAFFSDEISINVVAMGPVPEPEQVDVQYAEPAPVQEQLEEPVSEPVHEPVHVTEEFPDPEQTAPFELVEHPSAETDSAPIPSTPMPAAHPVAASPPESPTESSVDAPSRLPNLHVETKSDASAPPAAFSSIRAQRDDGGSDADAGTRSTAPTLAGVKRKDVGATAPGILPPAGEAIEDSPALSGQEPGVRFDPARLVKGLRGDPNLGDVAAPDTAASDAPRRAAKRASFFSRRSGGVRIAPPDLGDAVSASDGPTTGEAPADSPISERQRMTVFGARTSEDVGGKPRHLGLILTIALLLFLAGVAAWASLVLEDGVAGLFRRNDVPQIAVTEPNTAPVETPAITPEQDGVTTTFLAPTGTDTITDSAEIEAMEDELDEGEDAIDAAIASLLSQEDAQARYAVTGIWERAPQQPDTPPTGSIDEIYLASIDGSELSQDAIALPRADDVSTDLPMSRQAVPPAADATFDLDENGWVIATREGAITPEGITVFVGRPTALPKSVPKHEITTGAAATPAILSALARKRPKLRPSDMAVRAERTQHGGFTLSELASYRPRVRPPLAKADAERDTTATAQAVTASTKPRVRPSNFAQIVDRATPTQVAVATPVAATVMPSIPSTASVARQATIKNAINLGKVNLIGVYGTASNRRALVRLPNSRYKKVQVGDRIDGGKVVAIGEKELRYVKGGRNIVLKLPKI